jgi:hypothetical protein
MNDIVPYDSSSRQNELPINNVFGRLLPLWPFTYNEGSVHVPTGLVEAPHRLHRLQNKTVSIFECSNGLNSQVLLTNINYIPTVPTKGVKDISA